MVGYELPTCVTRMDAGTRCERAFPCDRETVWGSRRASILLIVLVVFPRMSPCLSSERAAAYELAIFSPASKTDRVVRYELLSPLVESNVLESGLMSETPCLERKCGALPCVLA